MGGGPGHEQPDGQVPPAGADAQPVKVVARVVGDHRHPTPGRGQGLRHRAAARLDEGRRPALLPLHGGVEHLARGERRRHRDHDLLHQLGQPDVGPARPRVPGRHVGPDGQLGEGLRAQRSSGAARRDHEVGAAAQGVVDAEGVGLHDRGRRVVGLEARQERRDDVGQGGGGGGDGHPVEPALRGHARRGAQGLGGREHVAGQWQQGPPGRRRREPAAGPLEQVDAQVALQLADLARQRRLGDPHPFGGRADRARVHHRDEVGEGPQLHGGIICLRGIESIRHRHWTAWPVRAETGTHDPRRGPEEEP